MSGVVYAETVRRHLTSVAFLGYLAFLVIVALGTSRFNSPAAAWPTLIALLAIITGSQPIGPEFSSGTLQLILVKPVTRSAYLLARVAGVATVTTLAAVVACAAELLGRALWAERLAADILGVTVLNTAVGAIFTVALLTFFGSFTRAYFNVAIFLILQVGLSVGMGLAMLARKWPILPRIIDQVNRNLFPDAPHALDAPWLLLVLSNAAVALVLACLIFRRREVPYGAD